LFAIGKEYFFLGSFLKAKTDSANKSATPAPLSPEAISAFKNADSTFTELTVASPNYAGGYLWKGRALSFLDPESTTGMAKPAYEQAATIMEKDPAKNKKGLIESYQYLASFNYLAYDKNYKASPDSAKVNRDVAVGFFEKILQLDPNDAKTKGILQQLKK
jgi:tetratricopeptide (TPR) repeat protein